MFEDFFRQHRFRQPYLDKVETVGPLSILWALITGPAHYWKKGARVEAVLLCASSIPLWFYNKHSAIISFATLSNATWIIWGASVILAPALLAMSFRRRGWTEITDAEPVKAARPRRAAAFADPEDEDPWRPQRGFGQARPREWDDEPAGDRTPDRIAAVRRRQSSNW